MIVVSFAPYRAVDLLSYQLLILRTSKQFKGLAWRDYDEAFRRDAAARAITDWSRLHVELYNYHTALSQAPVPSHRVDRAEGAGAITGTTICHSWNAGQCISTRSFCRYVHFCNVSRCRGPHCRIHCPSRSTDIDTNSIFAIGKKMVKQ